MQQRFAILNIRFVLCCIASIRFVVNCNGKVGHPKIKNLALLSELATAEAPPSAWAYLNSELWINQLLSRVTSILFGRKMALHMHRSSAFGKQESEAMFQPIGG